jgi:hypothetical protein
VKFADTELEPMGVPTCCVENFADFRERAEDTDVAYGQELVCPSCGAVVVLDPDARWRYAGE